MVEHGECGRSCDSEERRGFKDSVSKGTISKVSARRRRGSKVYTIRGTRSKVSVSGSEGSKVPVSWVKGLRSL